jgi:hypothetical protein
MRRVYPSEVVRFVAQYFPEAAEEIEPTTVKHFALPWRKKGFVRALVELTEALPQDLINLQADSYCALLSGVAALHTALEGWSHPEEHAIQWLDGIGNPLTIVWRELSKCSDEGPVARDVADLGFIPDAELKNVLMIDIGSVETALQHGEWKAATVLAGSVVEALLLWVVLQRHNPTQFETSFKNRFPKEGHAAEPQRWDLHQLIQVASDLQEINGETAQAAALAQNFRNLIHPGRAERLAMRADRGTAYSAVAAVHRNEPLQLGDRYRTL